ncbi:hypothetical protein V1477_011981 [Vespula maculifrons]|uniref:Uncharacterized protein n=1 Tax=Vespula maculifrons TaxID=7453 RepID=A0ABD2C0R2_VESMC
MARILGLKSRWSAAKLKNNFTTVVGNSKTEIGSAIDVYRCIGMQRPEKAALVGGASRRTLRQATLSSMSGRARSETS